MRATRPGKRSGLRFGSREPPVDEIWRRVGGELGGELEPGKRRSSRLHVPHESWRIVTDIYTQSNGESSTVYTRVRALFVRNGPFKLLATKRNVFHSLGLLVGYRAVPMGYGQLDRALFVRADRPDVAKSMLRGTSLGQSMMRDPIKLTVARPGRRIRKVTGDAVGEVQLLKSGKLREVAALRSMIQICMETLDELERLGVASDAPVENVAL